MRTIICRPMAQQDLDELAAGYREYFHEEDHWSLETARERIRQYFSMEQALCFVAEDSGTMAGFLIGHTVQWDDFVEYELVEILVFREYQRAGIGTQMMRYLEEELLRRGIKRIRLETLNDETHQNFYGKLGYQINPYVVTMKKEIGTGAPHCDPSQDMVR